MNRPITHVLLDIEGTTCPVSFVSDTLFPYAARELGSYLQRRRDDAQVQALVAAVMAGWQQDSDPTAQELLRSSERIGRRDEQDPGNDSVASPGDSALIVPYLQWLIAMDRKFTPLKELQGMVWEEGYRRGELVGSLFEEVPGTLKQWHQRGLVLAVYSSGSIGAQKLLYGHSQAGDLRPLFSHWFDTHIGNKQNSESYWRICKTMDAMPKQVLFISDSETELQAASDVGLQLAYSDRTGHPTPAGTPRTELSMAIEGVQYINNLTQLQLAHA